MSFIEMNLDEAQEAQIVEEGNYNIVISAATEKESKSSGKPMIECTLEISGQPNAQSIWYYLTLPHADDEEKTRNFKMLNLKRFLTAFNIPFDSSGFNVEDFPGAEANLRVKQSEPDDDGNIRNEIVLPKLQ